MARGSWVDLGTQKFTSRDVYVGFEWRYQNTEEDAKKRNVDVIRVRMYSKRDSSGSINPSNLNWNSVWLICKYGGSTRYNIKFERRFHFYNTNNTSKHYIRGSNYKDTKGLNNYLWGYYKGSSDYVAYNWNDRFDSNNAVMFPTVGGNTWGSKTATNNLKQTTEDGVTYCYYDFELEHNDDGTPKSVVNIALSSNGNGDIGNLGNGIGSGDHPCKLSKSITLSKIDRGTRIYVFDGSTWNKTATVHLKGEASGEQHYIYKYNGSSWIKYYG